MPNQAPIGSAASSRLTLSGSDSLKLFLLLLFYKSFIYGIVFLSSKFFPGMFSTAAYLQNFHISPTIKPGLASMLETWDGQIFIFLSQMGYQAHSISIVTYPLWPFVIKIGTLILGGHSAIAGLLLSNFFSILGLILFHRLISATSSKPAADRALLLMLAFPGALFFSFIYSESFFFFLTVLFFISLDRKKYASASFTSFLMTLTRPVGIFCALPFAWELASKKEKAVKWILCLSPLLALSIYFFLIYKATGDPFAGLKAQKFYIAHASISKILDFPAFFKTLFAVPLIFHGMLNSAMDRVWFLWFTVSLFFIWKKNKTYFIYALAMGLVPAMTVSLMSYTRYFLMVFPVFITTGDLFEKESRKGWLWLTLSILFSIQIIFLLRHVNNYWVA